MLALGLRDIVVIETIPCAGLIIIIPFRSCSAMNGLGSVKWWWVIFSES